MQCTINISTKVSSSNRNFSLYPSIHLGSDCLFIYPSLKSLGFLNCILFVIWYLSIEI